MDPKNKENKHRKYITSQSRPHILQNLYYLRHPPCGLVGLADAFRSWTAFGCGELNAGMPVTHAMLPLRVSVTLHNAWLSANLCIHRWIQTQQLGSSVVQGEIHRPTSKMRTTCICSM
jgi:hypothetical protein